MTSDWNIGDTVAPLPGSWPYVSKVLLWRSISASIGDVYVGIQLHLFVGFTRHGARRKPYYANGQ